MTGVSPTTLRRGSAMAGPSADRNDGDMHRKAAFACLTAFALAASALPAAAAATAAADPAPAGTPAATPVLPHPTGGFPIEIGRAHV